MEFSKPNQTAALQTNLSPPTQLTTSDNQIPIFTSANWALNQNQPNNPNPTSLPVRPFTAPRILMPWESVATQSPTTILIRSERFVNSQNSPTLNKNSLQTEASPKPVLIRGAPRASNKRPMQQVEASPRAQSATATDSVRSKLRESLAAALSIPTGEKSAEETQKQNGEDMTKQEEAPNDCESAIDELLQGNGLCWVENLQNPAEINVPKAPREDEKSLALKIEAELFRIFGGVNKKYKEKGRSLLFNLKDPNNPELRERVLSGDIKPERLCSMSAEELASKELSEWRQAKAEEMAQAIVLPDADVDMRKRVKKTHKGEFVVIEEEKDTSWAPLEAEIKANASVGANVGRVEQSVKGVKVEDEGSDLMLEIMGDGFSEVDHLSPVVTLDEFMKDLDSEPPFTDLGISNSEESAVHAPAQAQAQAQLTIEKDQRSGTPSDLKDEKLPSQEASVGVEQQQEISETAVADAEDGKIDSAEKSSVKPDLVADKLEVSSSKVTDEHGEVMWEGVVQLSVTSLASVVAFYRR